MTESASKISYLSGQDELILCAGDFPHRSYKKKVLLLAINNCNKSLIDQAYLVNMVGYCLLLFCIFIDLDFVSIKKKKKNSTNSQPSWPLAWSITNISSFFASEYEALDQELDQLNSCLDELETWNDSLNSRIKDLLENMQKAREEGRAMIGLGSKNTWRRFMQCSVMLNVRSRYLRATFKGLNVM